MKHCDFCDSYLHDYSVHETVESYDVYLKTFSHKIDSFLCSVRLLRSGIRDNISTEYSHIKCSVLGHKLLMINGVDFKYSKINCYCERCLDKFQFKDGELFIVIRERTSPFAYLQEPKEDDYKWFKK